MEFKTQLANMVIAEFMRHRSDDIDRYDELYLLNNSYLLFQGINLRDAERPIFKFKTPKNLKLIQKSYDSLVEQIVNALKPFVNHNGITVLQNPNNWAVTNARKTTITDSRKAPSLSKHKLQFTRIEFVIKDAQYVEVFDIYPRILRNQLIGVFLVSKPRGKTLWEGRYLNAKYECIENFSTHSYYKTFKNAFIVDFNFTNRLSNYLEMVKGIADGSLHDEVVKIRNQSKTNKEEIRNLIADAIGKEVGFWLNIKTDFGNQKNQITFVGDRLTSGPDKKNHIVKLVIDGTDVDAVKPYLKLFVLNGLTNQ